MNTSTWHDGDPLTTADLASLIRALEEIIVLYRNMYPPGTITADGRWRMGEDGKWWGRCWPVLPLGEVGE